MTTRPRGSLRAILRGMGLIARGRPEGLNCFGDTPKAFAASLTPGLGFMAGSLAQGLAAGQGMGAVLDLLSPFCALLAPPVLSYELARLWGREAFWHRYIVAYNWSRWLLLGLVLLAFVLVSLARGLGLMRQGGLSACLIGIALYALWLNWFTARQGLALTGGRAALLVLAVNVGTVFLVIGPALLAGPR